MPLYPKKIMLDTDIGPDCDDAAALGLVNLYANCGWIDVLCVTHCTSSPYGVGAIRAIDAWYGHDWPVGTMTRKGFLDDERGQLYNKALSETIPPERRTAEDAVHLMRRVLAAQEDGSVELIGIGPLRNIADLLDSAPDVLSPLDGEALCAKKCAGVTLMAGCFPPDETPAFPLPAVEWNIEMDVDAARVVSRKWHGEMTYCGWEVGAMLPTGAVMAEKLPYAHPVRTAYRLHNRAMNRPSWDLATVQFVCMRGCDATVRSEPGVVSIGPNGETTFSARPDGRHGYLKLAKAPAEAAAELDAWLVMEK